MVYKLEYLIRSLTSSILLLFLLNGAVGQPVSQKDSIRITEIDSIKSLIYKSSDKVCFLLTRQDLIEENALGMQIVAHRNNNAINRIVTIGMLEKGQMASEWYFDNGVLIYLFQSFEFFIEYEHLGSWKNFKGLSAWESRLYFDDKKIIFSKSTGEPTNSNMHYIKTADKILKFVVDQDCE